MNITKPVKQKLNPLGDLDIASNIMPSNIQTGPAQLWQGLKPALVTMILSEAILTSCAPYGGKKIIELSPYHEPTPTSIPENAPAIPIDWKKLDGDVYLRDPRLGIWSYQIFPKGKDINCLYVLNLQIRVSPDGELIIYDRYLAGQYKKEPESQKIGEGSELIGTELIEVGYFCMNKNGSCYYYIVGSNKEGDEITEFIGLPEPEMEP